MNTTQGLFGKILPLHEHFRFYRRKCFSKMEAIELCKRNHGEEWQQYCEAQKRGEKLDCLEQKDQARHFQMLKTGKLI